MPPFFNADTPKTLLMAPLASGGSLRVLVYTPACLRLTISTAPRPLDAPSYAVVQKKWADFDLATGPSESPAAPIARTSAMTIQCSADPFRIEVKDDLGTTRFLADGLEVDGRAIRLHRQLDRAEAVYGLGEAGETVNRNPGRYTLRNTDDPHYHPHKLYYCNIPAGIALPGGATGPHGFLLDNPGEVILDIGRTKPDRMTFETLRGDLDLWIYLEDDPAELLRVYTDLTGRMERPPLWALGYHQSRWSYPTSTRIREIAREFRQRRIPCDVIHFDIDYMEKFRVFTWNEQNFADHRELISDLHSDGFHVVAIVDPGVAIAEDYQAYTRGKDEPGFFVAGEDGRPVENVVWPGNTHHPDFTKTSNRRLWGEWQATHLLEPGIDGIWNDMNEPAVFEGRAFPGDAIFHDNGHYRRYLDLRNVYGHMMALASTEGQRAHAPEKRPFTLTRSGWAGIQRHSAVWTGDNSSVWGCMATDIVQNLSMGMSGVPFVGCDIGGFGSHATPELFARWMEWGVFQPFCRGHASIGSIDQEPWAFGPATEAVCRRMIELRYQLLPYIYTAFVEACETGLPVNRPLALAYPNDATVLSIRDCFLLGADLLVAPVLEPGADHRAVYLPAGDWVQYWSKERLVGGRWVLAPGPFGQPPLYVRGGAVLPMHPPRQHTGEPDPEVTYLEVYPTGGPLFGKLVEDDGATTDYHKGAESVVLFSGMDRGAELNLLIGEAKGSYRSARTEWEVRLFSGGRRISEVTCQDQRVSFQQTGGRTTFRIPENRKASNVRVLFAG